MGVDMITRCDENYWATMADLAHAVSGDVPVREDGLLLASCGSPIGHFNSAFLLPTERRSTHERLARAIEFFAGQGVPFVVRTRHAITPDVADVATEFGLRTASAMPIMALPTIGRIPPTPAGLEVARVDDAEDLAAHVDVAASAFGMPVELARGLFPESMIGTPGTELFVGRVDGQPVATSLVSVTGDMAGIYNVATLEGVRRRGFGEALTWWAVRAGARAGATAASLQASEMGQPVYARMGFDLIDDYLQYQGG